MVVRFLEFAALGGRAGWRIFGIVTVGLDSDGEMTVAVLGYKAGVHYGEPGCGKRGPRHGSVSGIIPLVPFLQVLYHFGCGSGVAHCGLQVAGHGGFAHVELALCGGEDGGEWDWGRNGV
jgi:hypothetical protein